MIALTRDDLIALQLACECLLADTARKQKAALKRKDEAALKRLKELGDAVSNAKRKLFEMQANN